MKKTRIQDVVGSLHARSGDRAAGRDKIAWLGSLRVRDIMSSPAICIDPESSVTSARLLLRERNIRRLPVLADRKLVGILTLGDVRGALPSEVTSLDRSELHYLTEQVRVERVMTQPVVTVDPDVSLKDAARLMIEHRISGVPVVSPAQEVVGMLTESDIFKTLVELLEIDERSQAGLAPSA
jgi:acetoin utilization protein AcuB